MTKRLERAAGGIMVDGQQTADTLQCCHCGMHWERKPGSGTIRGYCLKCNAVSCGKEACVTACKPMEKWLQEVESADRIRQQQAIDTFEQAAEGLVIVRN